jgi:hypothetical protein
MRSIHLFFWVTTAVFGVSASKAGEIKREDVALSTLDRGMLTTIISSGVARLDVSNGQLRIAYPDGHEVKLLINVPGQGGESVLARVPFFLLGGTGGIEATVCTSESINITTATQLLINSCGTGQSALCNSARDALGAVLVEVDDCLATQFPSTK